MTHTLAVDSVDPMELDQVNALAATLPQGSPVAVLLQGVVRAVARGSDVTLFDSDSEITPNEAAKLLHMSRPHLLKFMDRGELEFHRVGSHRRIRMSHLLDFIDRRERANADIAHAFGNHAAIANHVRDETNPLTEEDLTKLDLL